MTDYDVLIIGAGLAGLSCARYLLDKSADLNILVLEAKDRVGGRTCSVLLKTKDGGTEKYDVGAQWVGGSQLHILDLVEEFGLVKHRQYLTGRKYLQVSKDNTVKSYMSDIPTLSLLGLIDLDKTMKRIDGLAREIDQSDPYNHRRAEELDNMTVETYINNNMWIAEAKEVIRIAVRALMGVEPGDISFLYFLAYTAAAGGLKYLVEATPNTAQEFTLQGGTQQISEKLSENIGPDRIKLSEPVTKVTQTGTGATVTTTNGNTYTCKKLVLTLPSHLIGHITFEPPLPTAKRELIKRSFMANYVKVLITYKTAFWREDGASGEHVTHGGASPVGVACKHGPLVMGYDDTTESGNPALVTFLSGTQAIEWRDIQAEEKRKAVLGSLAQFFGDKVYDYIDYVEKDWDGEPYCGGAPVCCVTTGGMKYYTDGLRKPFKHVHMAGTETSAIWTGYMSGAVHSGHRAAIEILRQLRPHSVSHDDVKHNNRIFQP